MSEEGEVIDVEPEVSNPTNPITDLAPEEPQDEEAKPEVKEEPPPIPKGVQKRIDRAVREKYEAQARAKMLEERLSALEARQQAPAPQRTAASDEPTIDKFDNFDEYVTAKARWEAKQLVEQTLSEREKRQLAEREAVEHKQRADSWSKKLATATVEIPDFEEVIASSDVPMTEPMQHAIMESDVGPKIAYYLAQNPDEAVKIANMSPIGAIRSLGRLEERLAGQTAVKSVSKAPPPVSPPGSRSAVKKSPADMSDKEYEAWRRKGRT